MMLNYPELIIEKRSSETKLYHIDLSAEVPGDAILGEVLAVWVDDDDSASLEIAVPAEWVINNEPVSFPDGRLARERTVLQGSIGGGDDGRIYTIRVLYSRTDDPGPHEATVLLRVRDNLIPEAV